MLKCKEKRRVFYSPFTPICISKYFSLIVTSNNIYIARIEICVKIICVDMHEVSNVNRALSSREKKATSRKVACALFLLNELRAFCEADRQTSQKDIRVSKNGKI